VENFERTLGVKAGGTTPDMKFTLETVNCLGPALWLPWSAWTRRTTQGDGGQDRQDRQRVSTGRERNNSWKKLRPLKSWKNCARRSSPAGKRTPGSDGLRRNRLPFQRQRNVAAAISEEMKKQV